MSRRATADLAPPSRAVVDLAAGGSIETFLARVGGGGAEEAQSLAVAASMHGVSQILHRRLRDLPAGSLPPGLRDRLAREYALNRRRFRLQQEEGLRAVEAVREAGVDVLALKGLIHAHRLYDDPVERPMTDTDLLVRPEGFREAALGLLDAGFVWVERTERHLVLAPAGNEGYPHLWSDHPENRRGIELHARLLLEPFLVPLPLHGVWDRTETFRLEGREVRGLGLLDAILLLALGITEDLRIHRFRLIKALDLVRLVALAAGRDLDVARGILERGRRFARYAYPAFHLADRRSPDAGLAAATRALRATAGSRLIRWVETPDRWFACSHATPLPAHGTLLGCLALAHDPAEAARMLVRFLRPPLVYPGPDLLASPRRDWPGYYRRKLGPLRRRLASLAGRTAPPEVEMGDHG